MKAISCVGSCSYVFAEDSAAIAPELTQRESEREREERKREHQLSQVDRDRVIKRPWAADDFLNDVMSTAITSKRSPAQLIQNSEVFKERFRRYAKADYVVAPSHRVVKDLCFAWPNNKQQDLTHNASSRTYVLRSTASKAFKSLPAGCVRLRTWRQEQQSEQTSAINQKNINKQRLKHPQPAANNISNSNKAKANNNVSDSKDDDKQFICFHRFLSCLQRSPGVDIPVRRDASS